MAHAARIPMPKFLLPLGREPAYRLRSFPVLAGGAVLAGGFSAAARMAGAQAPKERAGKNSSPRLSMMILRSLVLCGLVSALAPAVPAATITVTTANSTGAGP
jgi:hypothetical protein